MAKLGLHPPGSSTQRLAGFLTAQQPVPHAPGQHARPTPATLPARGDQQFVGTSGSRKPQCKLQSALVEADTQPALGDEQPTQEASPLDSVRLDSEVWFYEAARVPISAVV